MHAKGVMQSVSSHSSSQITPRPVQHGGTYETSTEGRATTSSISRLRMGQPWRHCSRATVALLHLSQEIFSSGQMIRPRRLVGCHSSSYHPRSIPPYLHPLQAVLPAMYNRTYLGQCSIGDNILVFSPPYASGIPAMPMEDGDSRHQTNGEGAAGLPPLYRDRLPPCKSLP